VRQHACVAARALLVAEQRPTAAYPCLQLAGNMLSGPFPLGFALTNTSFWSVMSFRCQSFGFEMPSRVLPYSEAYLLLNMWCTAFCSFARNQLSGPLPNYVNGMITMSIVRLESNRFTG
jgi:hypothetical protein